MKNLFERLLALVEKFEPQHSQTAFAKSIGYKQPTFHGYLNAEGQSKIKLTLLENILAKYPQVSREWLYFGEGEMFGGGGPKRPPSPYIDMALLQQVIEILEEYLKKRNIKMAPAKKAAHISRFYALVVEREEQAREPVQMMRLVMNALASAANE